MLCKEVLPVGFTKNSRIIKKENVVKLSEQNATLYTEGCRVGVLFFKIPESESYQKRGLRIGHTCFHDFTEYNEIMDSA